jgi:hypothetical protein
VRLVHNIVLFNRLKVADIGISHLRKSLKVISGRSRWLRRNAGMMKRWAILGG